MPSVKVTIIDGPEVTGLTEDQLKKLTKEMKSAFCIISDLPLIVRYEKASVPSDNLIGWSIDVTVDHPRREEVAATLWEGVLIDFFSEIIGDFEE